MLGASQGPPITVTTGRALARGDTVPQPPVDRRPGSIDQRPCRSPPHILAGTGGRLQQRRASRGGIALADRHQFRLPSEQCAMAVMT